MRPDEKAIVAPIEPVLRMLAIKNKPNIAVVLLEKPARSKGANPMI
jgi:hypothetical protein